MSSHVINNYTREGIFLHDICTAWQMASWGCVLFWWTWNFPYRYPINWPMRWESRSGTWRLKTKRNKQTNKQQQFSEEHKNSMLGRMASAQDILILAFCSLLLELPMGCHATDTRQPRLRLSHKGRSVCQVFKEFMLM